MTKEVLHKISDDEYNSFELISTKLQCARVSLENVPERLSEESKATYVKAVVESLSDYMWLEKDWWNRIFDAVKIPRFSCDLQFDGVTREIYRYVE